MLGPASRGTGGVGWRSGHMTNDDDDICAPAAERPSVGSWHAAAQPPVGSQFMVVRTALRFEK